MLTLLCDGPRSWLRLCTVIRNSASFTLATPVATTSNSSQITSEHNATGDEPVDLESNPFRPEKGKCVLCRYGINPDYKNTKLLSQFVSPFTGHLYSPNITRICSRQHEQLKREILKAQNAGFMPYYHKDPAYLKDPTIFDPNRPIRPHNYK